jgi:hypothetical protein
MPILLATRWMKEGLRLTRMGGTIDYRVGTVS